MSVLKLKRIFIGYSSRPNSM